MILKGEHTDPGIVNTSIQPWLLERPAMAVFIHMTIDQAESCKLRDFMSDKVDVTIEGEDLKLSDRINLFTATSSISDQLGKNVKQTLVTINMRKIKTSVRKDILFCFQDAAFVMSTTGGIIEFYTYHDDNPTAVKFTYQSGIMVKVKAEAEKLDKFSLAMEFVEGLYFLLKLGGLMAAVVFSGMDRMETHRLIQSAKEKLRPEAKQSWADIAEEEVPTSKVLSLPDAPEYTPKNMRQKSGLEDSDPSVKTNKNQTQYVNESNERLVPPKPVVEKKIETTASELNNEARQLLRKTLMDKTSKHKPMIESADKSHIKTIPSTASINLDKLPTLSQIPQHVNDSQLSDHSFKEVLASSDDLKPLMNEALKDAQAFSLVPLIRKNTIFIGVPDKIIVRGLMVYNSVGITNAHAVASWKQGDIFRCFEATQNGSVESGGGR